VTFPIVRDTERRVTRAWNVRILRAASSWIEAGAVRHVLIAPWTGQHRGEKELACAVAVFSRRRNVRQTSPQACVAGCARTPSCARGSHSIEGNIPCSAALAEGCSAAGTVAAVKLIVACAQAKGWRVSSVATRDRTGEGRRPCLDALPLSQDTDYFRRLPNSCSGNSERAEIVYDPTYRARWCRILQSREMQPALDVISRFTVRERNVVLRQAPACWPSREEQAPYLKRLN